MHYSTPRYTHTHTHARSKASAHVQSLEIMESHKIICTTNNALMPPPQTRWTWHQQWQPFGRQNALKPTTRDADVKYHWPIHLVGYFRTASAPSGRFREETTSEVVYPFKQKRVSTNNDFMRLVGCLWKCPWNQWNINVKRKKNTTCISCRTKERILFKFKM